MTEEQIRQNAADYVYNFQPTGVITEDRLKCYIAGAHSRDKEIECIKNEAAAIMDEACALKIELDKLRNPWISVNERLPEEFQIVFVHMQGGSCDSAIYTNGVFRRDLQLKFGMKDDGYTLISWQQMFKSNITHWMPIPELKKGE